jgi:1,4-dihydroxy-2-naphthoate octaprenyltransferase
VDNNIRSTLQLLRFHFSFFLMPVYFFALSQVQSIHWQRALLIFIILHVLVYPASNGYNSFMDRDTESIGGIEKPFAPTSHLFYTTIVLDVVAVILSLFISLLFCMLLLGYILASKAYSYRKVRLKKYPFAGFATVIVFQGAITFLMVYYGCNTNPVVSVPVSSMIAASLLIGGIYPLTQIYQHEADKKDGVITISYRLGYRGTFVFCAVVYVLAFIVLGKIFNETGQLTQYILLQIFMLPALVYFFIWFFKVWRNKKEANFKNTMRMNLLASVCTNLGFISILIFRFFE